MTTTSENLETLETTVVSDTHHQLALDYAPRIRFDAKEPFLPSVVGYTVFDQSAPSPSFPRQIDVAADLALAIEYAIWWDGDSGQL